MSKTSPWALVTPVPVEGGESQPFAADPAQARRERRGPFCSSPLLVPPMSVNGSEGRPQQLAASPAHDRLGRLGNCRLQQHHADCPAHACWQ